MMIEIEKLPIISASEMDEFYNDGEFEAAVIEDFNLEADIIDKKYNNEIHES